MKTIIYPLFLVLLLTACSQQETQIQVTTEPAETGVESDYSEAFLNASEAQLLFKEDLSVAYFIGEGNEYATFTETTHWLSNQYVEVTIDNGGSIIHRYFYVKENAVYLVAKATEGEPAFTLQQLDSMPIGEPLLHFPLVAGAIINEWRIVDTEATVVTPFKTFENAIIFEKQTIDETTRIYVALGFGVIKNEFILRVDGNEETITSTLSSIDYE